MRFSADQHTLAYHLEARPLTSCLDFKGMPTKHFGDMAREYLGLNKPARPESEAVVFYMANHVIAALRKKRGIYEQLPKEELALLERMYKEATDTFLRLVYYVAVICVRESRHLHDKGALKSKAKELGLSHALDYVVSVNDDPTTAMQEFIDNAPEGLTLGELAACLSFVFYKGSWSSGYGGPKWGAVADALVNVVSGQYTPEMFCDVGYTLAHNGGPIFNKGMFYSHYDGEIYRVLDVQRAGQIPKFIRSGEVKYCPSWLKTLAKGLDWLGADFVGEVDWSKVKKTGGGSYAPGGTPKTDDYEGNKSPHHLGSVEIWNVGTSIKVEKVTRAGIYEAMGKKPTVSFDDYAKQILPETVKSVPPKSKTLFQVKV